MEIDPKVEAQLQIEVHPLAIVNMSDHFTRVTCGGSPLDPSAPVVGLLFGKTEVSSSNNKDSKNGRVVEILDSDDIPVTQDATTQVSLHQAVFPQHSVVGWYRVEASATAEVEPTPSDLQITAQLQQRHGGTCLFLLLPAPDPFGSQKPAAATGSNKDDDDDSSLPLRLYQLADTQQSFISLESSWTLETFEPERIAIEHVVRAQPLRLRRPPTAEAAAAAAASHMAAAALSLDGQPPTLPVEPKKPSVYSERTQDVHHSWHMLEQRLGVLEQFLEDTVQGRIPWQPAVLRQVQGLLWQLGPMAAGLGGNDDMNSTTTTGETKFNEESSDLVQQLAALTKTVDAVQSYTDKFRMVHEASGSSRGSGMMREGRHHRGGPRGMFHHRRPPSS